MHKMISVRTPSLLSSSSNLDHIVSFLSEKEVCNLFLVEKSINASIKDLVKCFSDVHTSFNTSISTAAPAERLAIMERLDRSIRFFGPVSASPRWAPQSLKLPAGFTLGGFGANCNKIVYSIGYLSENPANHQPLVAAGVHNSLSALLRDHQATPEAKEWAALALCYLSHNPDNRQPLVVDGVHNQLSALLSDPQATPSAGQFATLALENLDLTPRGCCVIL